MQLRGWGCSALPDLCKQPAEGDGQPWALPWPCPPGAEGPLALFFWILRQTHLWPSLTQSSSQASATSPEKMLVVAMATRQCPAGPGSLGCPSPSLLTWLCVQWPWPGGLTVATDTAAAPALPQTLDDSLPASQSPEVAVQGQAVLVPACDSAAHSGAEAEVWLLAPRVQTLAPQPGQGHGSRARVYFPLESLVIAVIPRSPETSPRRTSGWSSCSFGGAARRGKFLQQSDTVARGPRTLQGDWVVFLFSFFVSGINLLPLPLICPPPSCLFLRQDLAG